MLNTIFKFKLFGKRVSIKRGEGLLDRETYSGIKESPLFSIYKVQYYDDFATNLVIIIGRYKINILTMPDGVDGDTIKEVMLSHHNRK